MAAPTEPAPLASAVFVGTARDCARHLPAALARWDDLATLFDTRAFLVAENDSVDATKEILARWSAGDSRRRVLTLDGLDQTHSGRAVKLAHARNRLLDAVAAEPRLRAADYLVVMDLDEVSLDLTPARLARCMTFAGWDALFANQFPTYYDIWALREPRRSPDDFLAHIERAPPGWRRLAARLRHMNWRNRPFWPFGAPIPVTSAFGGFAIYRTGVALSARYAGERDGRPICEHVPFHEAMAAHGARLFLHPGLLNALPRPIARLFGRR